MAYKAAAARPSRRPPLILSPPAVAVTPMTAPPQSLARPRRPAPAPGQKTYLTPGLAKRDMA